MRFSPGSFHDPKGKLSVVAAVLAVDGLMKFKLALLF
jgi:hypothetical protein